MFWGYWKGRYVLLAPPPFFYDLSCQIILARKNYVSKLTKKIEFLDNLVYNCQKVSNPLTDIPRRWEPYLPHSYPTSSPSPSSSTAATGTVLTATTAAATGSPATAQHLSTGAIAGIAIAATLVLFILALLAKLYYSTKKKATRLRIENAELADATNPDGASRRITALMSGASSLSSQRSMAPGDPGSVYNDATLVGSPLYSPRHALFGEGAAAGAPPEVEDYDVRHGASDCVGETGFELRELDKAYYGRPSPGTAHELGGGEIGEARGGGSVVQPVPPPRVYDDSESDYESVRRW